MEQYREILWRLKHLFPESRDIQITITTTANEHTKFNDVITRECESQALTIVYPDEYIPEKHIKFSEIKLPLIGSIKLIQE